MSIHYYSDLKDRYPLENYPVESQQSVIFNDKVYEVLTYRVPSDWIHKLKTLYKMFSSLLSIEWYRTGEKSLTCYFTKVFSRYRRKQVVVPQNDLKPHENMHLSQVEKESRLGRLLYWEDILLSVPGSALTKADFLSKHFSKLPASSNFAKICLMTVFPTRSNVAFTHSGDFEQDVDQLKLLPEDKVLVLFHCHAAGRQIPEILRDERFLKEVACCPVDNNKTKQFRVFGLAQDKALPFPQGLVDMLIKK